MASFDFHQTEYEPCFKVCIAPLLSEETPNDVFHSNAFAFMLGFMKENKLMFHTSMKRFPF